MVSAVITINLKNLTWEFVDPYVQFFSFRERELQSSFIAKCWFSVIFILYILMSFNSSFFFLARQVIYLCELISILLRYF